MSGSSEGRSPRSMRRVGRSHKSSPHIKGGNPSIKMGGACVGTGSLSTSLERANALTSASKMTAENSKAAAIRLEPFFLPIIPPRSPCDALPTFDSIHRCITPSSVSALISDGWPFKMRCECRALDMRPGTALNQAQRRIAFRTRASISKMFHPCCTRFGLIAGLEQIFHR